MSLVRILHNPILLRMIIVAVAAGFAFVLAIVLFRWIRRSVSEVPEITRVSEQSSNNAFMVAAYDGVIRTLREQEKEMKAQREAERDQAASAQQISEALLAGVDVGVVFFDRRGIVRHTNPALRSILGYASPLGFHIRDLLRGFGEPAPEESNADNEMVAALLQAVQEGKPLSACEAGYRSPSGGACRLRVSAQPVKSKAGQLLGMACVVSNLTSQNAAPDQSGRGAAAAPGDQH